jgi:preprotein translocase subunit SecE
MFGKENKVEGAKKDKVSFAARGARWSREMKSEFKKVLWPTRKQTINNTLVVIACVIIVGIFIWVFDFLADQIVSALLALFKG